MRTDEERKGRPFEQLAEEGSPQNDGFECDAGLSNTEEINNPPDSPNTTVKNN